MRLSSFENMTETAHNFNFACNSGIAAMVPSYHSTAFCVIDRIFIFWCCRLFMMNAFIELFFA